MKLDMFSNNENYVMEEIPRHINYFQKKKWIKEKIALMGRRKSLVFSDKKHILCAFLDENEQYWLPAEKVKFYLYVFQLEYPYIIIAENDNNKIHYYGVLNNFLVVFTKDYDEAMENMLSYSKGKEIRILGVGDIDLNCYKYISFDEIFSKFFKDKEKLVAHNNSYKNIDDELIYLNEEHDAYNNVQDIYQEESHNGYQNETNLDEAFLYWFHNFRGKEKINRKYFLFSLIIGIVTFFIASFYIGYNEAEIIKEMDLTMQKIRNLENK